MANKKCLCCASKYDFCPNCGRDRLAPAWKSTFCSESCKDLWHILSRFSMNFITKSEAAEKIFSLELKDKSEYVASVQRDLEKVFAPEPKLKRGMRAKVAIPEEVKSELSIESHEVVIEKENE